MNAFKEWLSDYLRYFVLILAVLLALGAIFLGVKLYQSTQTENGDPDSITVISATEILTETESETQTEKLSETEKGTEKKTEKHTEKKTEVSEQTEKETAVNQKTEEKNALTERTAETQPAKEETSPVVILNSQEAQRQTEPVQTEVPTEAPQPVTETETDPPQPVYLTMTGACYIRSYADYGDNIIGEYPAGTVVEFLEDVGGWYKVQIDGMVGYMGARFFK